MEINKNMENICQMETELSGLSDIIEILNTIDSPNGEVIGVQQTNYIQVQSQPTTLPAPSLTTLTPKETTTQQQQSLQSPESWSAVTKPFINIIEQPASKALRFRYECEGRSAGSIPGVHSTPENKTFPTIEIVGYRGDVVVVVSCVTKDPPYRPHPHNLVGKDGCKNGICTLVLNNEPLRAVFSNLGIQCVKKKDIKAALDLREEMKVDPFNTKFGHKDQPSSIDLNAVRLCFQAFLKTAKRVQPLSPVVSDPIYDKKAMSDLVICRLCSCSAKVAGGDEIILLCEKVSKDDIKVKFFEQNNEGKTIWEDYAEFQQTDIHKQTAIAFRTPRYHNTDIMEKAKVFLQLLRPSDGVTSESLPFEYYPDPDQIKRKRLKTHGNPMTILQRELQKYDQPATQQNEFKDASTFPSNFWHPMPDIKCEPAMSPPDFGNYRSPYHASPSPQPMSPMNRNATPSPGLMKTSSGSSQTQMCANFEMNLKSPLPFIPSPQPMVNNVINGNGIIGNSFMANTPVTPTAKSPYNSLSITGTGISGGSVTPVWTPSPTSQQNNFTILPNMNIIEPMQQPQQQQQPVQQQQQQQTLQSLVNDIELIASNSTEEGPTTLSGLLAFVENEQLVNINSDDFSSLSITT